MNIDCELGIKGVYDNRYLQQCRCGEHWYPSKKMFLEFLKQFKDINAEVSIHSISDAVKGTGRITVELEYPIDPDGFMSYKGKLFCDERPDGYNEFEVKAISFDDAIKEMSEQLIICGEEIKIWHHGLWQPVRWYMEEEENDGIVG